MFDNIYRIRVRFCNRSTLGQMVGTVVGYAYTSPILVLMLHPVYLISDLEFHSCWGKATFSEERALPLQYQNIYGQIFKRHQDQDQNNGGRCSSMKFQAWHTCVHVYLWSVVAERSSLPDSSSGVSSRMWVRITAVTLVSLSKTLNHNCFSPPRG